MTFLWPQMLWLLAALPLLTALYVFLLKRKTRTALRYSSLGLVKAAIAGIGYRRHVPPVLMLAALAGILLAMARPATSLTLPSQHETVVLAIDISGSMKAQDVKPNRLAAAQAAARAFVADTPASSRIGVVAFAGDAALVQAPTHNRDDVLAAIDGLQLQHATAVGSGILVSLKAIFPAEEFDLAKLKKRQHHKPVPPGSYSSAAIILLTDGQTTAGPDPVEAAQVAADRGVRVFTVGVGTPNGHVVSGEGWSMRVKLDEEPLKRVAGVTRAEYFFAGSAPDLKRVYERLTSRLVMEKRKTEITALFSAAAALMILASAGLSLAWFGRVL